MHIVHTGANLPARHGSLDCRQLPASLQLLILQTEVLLSRSVMRVQTRKACGLAVRSFAATPKQ